MKKVQGKRVKDKGQRKKVKGKSTERRGKTTTDDRPQKDRRARRLGSWKARKLKAQEIGQRKKGKGKEKRGQRTRHNPESFPGGRAGKRLFHRKSRTSSTRPGHRF